MTTNPFTAEAAESAAAAQAFNGSTNPERHRLLVEAVGFATVGNAIDTAELLAMQRATKMESAQLQFGLIPAENALDLDGIDDDGRALLVQIRNAYLDPESTLQVAAFDDTSYETDRIALAARVLGIDEERLAAFFGAEREYVITDTDGFDAFAEARGEVAQAPELDANEPEPWVDPAAAPKAKKGKKSKGGE